MSRSPVRRLLARLPEPEYRRADLSVAAYCSAFGTDGAHVATERSED